MSDTMRILHFVPKDCLPVNTGAKLRNYYFARQLAAKANVTYLSFAEDIAAHQDNSSPSKDQTFLPLERFCKQVISLPYEKSYTVSKIVRGLVGRYPLTVLNYTTAAMAETLKRTLDENDFDLVHVEGLLLAAYLPIIRAAKSRPFVVCDWHNIDSEVMQRYSKHAPSVAQKVYAYLTKKRLQTLERQGLDLFDGHFVVSERDRKKLLEISPDSRIFVADNGVDSAFYSDKAIENAYALWRQQNSDSDDKNARNEDVFNFPNQRNRLLFVGSMDYHANADAVEKFVKEVWPKLFARNPQIKFTIVGRRPSAEIHALAKFPGVEVTGTVEDVRPYYREAFAAVVPLRIGGGSRLKILEAMAAGVPVISTRLGAEGLEVQHKQNILLAEWGEDFIRAVFEIIENKTLQQDIAQNARSFVIQRYDWSAIGKTLFNSYKLIGNDSASSGKTIKNISAEAIEVSA
jgi:glycosyltransferase involved in cell wall biosynthesis